MVAFSIELDLCGLKCPLPVMCTRKALRRLAPGDVVVVHCTDPLASIDIPHLARSEGHEVETGGTTDGVVTFRITKGVAEDPRASDVDSESLNGT